MRFSSQVTARRNTKPRKKTGRMRTASPYHLLPGGQQIRGANLVVPFKTDTGYDTIWAETWAEWNWADFQARIDLAKSTGCNTVRHVGSYQAVIAGYLSLETYLAQWSQLIDYCESVGLYVMAMGGDGYDAPGYDRWSTYSVSNPNDIVAQAVALGSLLQTKVNIAGYDVWGENPLHSLRSTAAAAVRAVTDVPISFSTWQHGIHAITMRNTIRADCDFYDFHIYDFTRCTRISEYWTAEEDKPCVFNEFSTLESNNDVAEKFGTLETTLRTVTDGSKVFAGACIWGIKDYNAQPTDTFCLWRANGNPRVDHLTAYLKFPNAF